MYFFMCFKYKNKIKAFSPPPRQVFFFSSLDPRLQRISTNSALPHARVQVVIPAQTGDRHQPRHRRVFVALKALLLAPPQRLHGVVRGVPPGALRRRLVTHVHHVDGAARHCALRHTLRLLALEVRLDAVVLKPVEAELLHRVLARGVDRVVLRHVWLRLAALETAPERIAVLRQQTELLRLGACTDEPAMGLRAQGLCVLRDVRPGARQVLADDPGVLIVELEVLLGLESAEALGVVALQNMRLGVAELLQTNVPDHLAVAPAGEVHEHVLIREAAVVQLHALVHEGTLTTATPPAVHGGAVHRCRVGLRVLAGQRRDVLGPWLATSRELCHGARVGRHL
eukprot:PhM_4_TR15377/c0_g1_i1/m.57347